LITSGTASFLSNKQSSIKREMYPMGSRFVFAILVSCAACSSFAQSQSSQNYLADNVVLIVRHAEKPENGKA
jgi:hypothetical protein